MQIFASTTFSEPCPSDLDEVLGKLDELELDGIELGSTHRGRDDFVAMVKACRHSRFLVHNFFPPEKTGLVVNIASTDSDIRHRSLDHARSCIHFCEEVGAEIYTLHPGFLNDPVATNGKTDNKGYDFVFSHSRASRYETMSLMIDSVASLAEEATNKGVRLAIETEGSLTSKGVLLMETPDDWDYLFQQLPNIWMNFNHAHTSLAAECHGFDVETFLKCFRSRIAAIELSHHHDGVDAHAPLQNDSEVLGRLGEMPDVPLILEFRDAAVSDIANSRDMLRHASQLHE